MFAATLCCAAGKRGERQQGERTVEVFQGSLVILLLGIGEEDKHWYIYIYIYIEDTDKGS